MAALRIEEKPRDKMQEYTNGAGGDAMARCSTGCTGPVRQDLSCGPASRGRGTQGSFDFEIEAGPSREDHGKGANADQASDAQYRVVVETMTEGALILSSGGTILYCNRGFSRMIGIVPERLVGSPFVRLVSGEDRGLFENVLKESADGQAQAEVVLLAGNGGRFAVYLSGSAQITDDDTRVCMIVTDISKRVQAENALKQAKDRLEQIVETLQESQAKYLDLYENANDIIFTLDLRGHFTSANRTTYRELGFEPESVMGKSFLRIFTPESARSASLLIEKALANRPRVLEEQPWEFEAVAGNGSVINLEVRARFICEGEAIVGIQCIARNITERKQVEMELVRLATAIEQAAESVIILDKSGKIQYANKAFFRISGYDREEVRGRTTAFLKSNKKDDETFYRGMLGTVSMKSVWTGRISNRKKDGSTYEAETTITPVRDKSGKVVNYVALERDVTEEVRLERQLRQMQKMEAIGTLAGGIAHDFNNILSAIIGFSEMSLEDIPEDHPAKNYAAQILKAATRGRDLVRQIMVFSRKNEEERKHFKLGLIIREALKLLRASLPSTIEIRERIEAESGVIFASPTQIHQVLMNLCTNAGHAMRIKGGVLEVGLSEIEVDLENGAPCLGMEQGPYLKMSISDTGEGMTPEVLDRIFEPFFTTKSPSEGTGMGLAVVHGIVKGHGGAITAKSTPGRGSVFDVYFSREGTAYADEVETASDSGSGTGRILLIDDEDAIIEMGTSVLRRLGYEVHSARDGLEALKIFSRGPGRFDLVITDQTMPHMTGTELAKELMALRPDIPIILCTGYSEIINREIVKDLGIREFIMKPVSRSELAESISRVLENRDHP
ncbi:MAG: PAS domain S-box protein [Syntrophorhabdales bacterium]|jgi:PAS domain S-box-containing protein